jgi:hypothetical protein
MQTTAKAGTITVIWIKEVAELKFEQADKGKGSKILTDSKIIHLGAFNLQEGVCSFKDRQNEGHATMACLSAGLCVVRTWDVELPPSERATSLPG